MENIKGKKIIIVSIIIILLILAFTLKIVYDNNRKYEVVKVSSLDYFLLIEDGRCGVLSKSGEVIIAPEYDDIQIPNPSKPLFICMSNYDENTKQYNITVLNEKSEKILYEYVNLEAIYIENTTSSMPYDTSVLKYKENDKWGIIDFSGKKITKPIYEDIKGLTFREGLLAVKKDSKYGVINIKGTTIIKHQYDDIKCDGYYNQLGNYNNAGFITSIKTSNGFRYGYVDYNGKLILKPEYNDITRIIEKKDDKNAFLVAFKNGRAAVYQNSKILIKHDYEDIFYNKQNDLLIVQKGLKQGVLKFNSEEVIPIKFSNIIISGKYINAQTESDVEVYDINGVKHSFNGYISVSTTDSDNNNIAITSDDIYRLVDNSGNVITKNDYNSLKNIDKDNYIAKKYSKYGIIDLNEKILIDFEYDIIQTINNTKIIQAIKLDENRVDLYNENLVKVASLDKATIFLESNYVKMTNENTVKYFDYQGKELLNKEVFENKIYAIKQNNKWGFADKDGNIIVDPKYEFVTEINSNGFAGIKSNGKWGSINSDGHVIKEPEYELLDGSPEFIGEYYKVDYGYGTPYYTK